MFYANFCAYYSKLYIGNTNGSQLVLLSGDELENEISKTPYPKVLQLLGSNEKMICCKYIQVEKYHIPNRSIYREGYAQKD